MSKEIKRGGQGAVGPLDGGLPPFIDSQFRLIIVAGLRAKQLLNGSKPRIEASKSRRRNTSIALEEVKRGLIRFTNGKDLQPETITAAQPHNAESGIIAAVKQRS